MKKHETKNGTFYSEWAFNDKRVMDAAQLANRETLDNLLSKLRVVNTGSDYEWVRPGCNRNGEPFEYRHVTTTYARFRCLIVTKPEWMTMSEAALVLDSGNLCFGFNVDGIFIDVYTD